MGAHRAVYQAEQSGLTKLRGLGLEYCIAEGNRNAGAWCQRRRSSAKDRTKSLQESFQWLRVGLFLHREKTHKTRERVLAAGLRA